MCDQNKCCDNCWHFAEYTEEYKALTGWDGGCMFGRIRVDDVPRKKTDCCRVWKSQEPVRFAAWVPQPCGAKKPLWYECSNCLVVGSPHWKRCPQCEAKMLERVGTEVKS